MGGVDPPPLRSFAFAYGTDDTLAHTITAIDHDDALTNASSTLLDH